MRSGTDGLGAKQRSTTPETAGLTLMGDRLYNSATGRFTSLDPEPGGSANAYAYPTDPINQYDLNGHWWGWHRTLSFAATWGGVAAGVGCIVLSAGACAIAGGIALGLSAAYHAHSAATHRESWGSAFTNVGIDAVLTFVNSKAARLVSSHSGGAIRRLGNWFYRGRHVGSSSWVGGVARGACRIAHEYIGNWSVRPLRTAYRHALGAAGIWRSWNS